MSTIDELVCGFGPATFIEALPGYQRRLVEDLANAGNSDWDIVGIWLRLSGPSTTFPMGGGPQSDFSSRFRDELRSLVCGDDRYESERSRILSQGEVTQAALITAIAAVLSPALGTAAVFISTPVAVALSVLARLGVGAWCAGEST